MLNQRQHITKCCSAHRFILPLSLKTRSKSISLQGDFHCMHISAAIQSMESPSSRLSQIGRWGVKGPWGWNDKWKVIWSPQVRERGERAQGSRDILWNSIYNTDYYFPRLVQQTCYNFSVISTGSCPHRTQFNNMHRTASVIIFKYPKIPSLLSPSPSSLSLFQPPRKPCIISHCLPATTDYADLVFSPQQMPMTHSFCGKCLRVKAACTHSWHVSVLLRSRIIG